MSSYRNLRWDSEKVDGFEEVDDKTEKTRPGGDTTQQEQFLTNKLEIAAS